MSRSEFLEAFAELVELPAGSLAGEEKLEDIQAWDSMSLVGFIALANTASGVKLSPRDIGACETVNELANLAGIPAAN